MNKYYIEYYLPVSFVVLENTITFSVTSNEIKMVELKQYDENRLSIKFYFENCIECEEGKNECNNQLRNIINKIAFEYEMAQVGRPYYSGNSNLKKNTRTSEMNAKVTLANSESEEKLKNCLIDSIEYSSRYYELFRLSMQSTDVVNRYMFLYQILLDMHGPTQYKVDLYIRKCSKKLEIDCKYKMWQEKRGNCETIFTYLRNQVGHIIDGHSPDSISVDMGENIYNLIKIVKYSMKEQCS